MKTPSGVFLVIATLAGLCFALVAPPLRFPDEIGHYLRIASVAESLVAREPREPGTVLLPGRIVADAKYFALRSPDVTRGRPFDIVEISSRIQSSGVQDAGRIPASVPSAQMIPGAVAYIPQAIAFEIAMRAGGSFLESLWATRMAVLLASVLINVVALKLMPAWARWTSVAVSLLPMAAYMRGSASPDAIVTAVTLLGMAAFLDGAGRNDFARSSSVVALVACLYLAVVKPPYICILLLGLLWLSPRRPAGPHPRIKIAIVAVIWAATLAVAAWHSAEVAQFAARIRQDVSPEEIAVSDKLRMLVESPLVVGAIFARTLLAAPGLVYSTIARFGWADINPPPILHALVILWSVGVVYLDRHPIVRNVPLRHGAIMLSTFAAQIAVVMVTTWLVWTETASPMITGLQGRYFLPALACGVLGAAALVLRLFRTGAMDEGQVDKTTMPRLVAGGSSVLLGAALMWLVLGEFYNVQGFHGICLHELCAPG